MENTEWLDEHCKRIRDIASQDNWDEEGTPRIDEKTIQRARAFILRMLACPAIEGMTKLPRPGVSDAADIDISWYTEKLTALINVPAYDCLDNPEINYHTIKEHDLKQQRGGTIDEFNMDEICEMIAWMVE